MIPIFSAKKIHSDEDVFGIGIDGNFLIEKVCLSRNEDKTIRKQEDGDYEYKAIYHHIDSTTLKISFDISKSFIKLSDLEVHTCTDFGLTYSDMKMRTRREIQPANGTIFTVITDKGR